MRLLKHIFLALLICLTSGCSGSKMEPVGEGPFLENSETDGRLSLDGDGSEERLTLNSDGQSGGNQGQRLRLPSEMQEPPPPARTQAAAPPARPASPVIDPASVAGTGCPTCPPPAQVIPCQPNCPQVGLLQPPPPLPAQPVVEPCSVVQQRTLFHRVPYSELVPRETKIVFVVDKGLHNYQPSEYAPHGNDSQAATRIHHIRQFFEAYKNTGWFSWSMITFRGTARGRNGRATAFISSDERGRNPIFTKDHNLVAQAINKLSPTETPDGEYDGGSNSGNVHYGAALEMARELIEKDLREQRDEVEYLVFFITGSSPDDREHQDRWSFDDYLYPEVGDIVEINPEKVFFSTAYYGWGHLGRQISGDGVIRNIPNVKDILREMARIGNGEFINLTNITGQAAIYYDNRPNAAVANPVTVMEDVDPNAASYLVLPGLYHERGDNVAPSPCTGVLPAHQTLPCGHSAYQHAQGVQCTHR